MGYFIGIDGGETNTVICALCANDLTLKYTMISGLSWKEHGLSKIVKEIRHCVQSFLDDGLNQISGLAMGIPCYGESTVRDVEIKQSIQEAFTSVPIYFTNDTEVKWAGSNAIDSGINVVSGIGSIAFGKDDRGNTAKSGGWSEFFSDEGSCYWIGRKVMELFSKQSDGRCPRDELYDTVRQEFNLKNDFEFIDIVYGYSKQRDQVAGLELLAEKAARAGSISAISLYTAAASELYLLVKAVYNQLYFEKNTWLLSYSGGLFKAGDLVIPHLRTAISADGGKLISSQFEPVQGALLLALQQFAPQFIHHVKHVVLTEEKEKRLVV